MEESCEICGNNEWSVFYQGAIRDGAYGNYKEDAVVLECGVCGVQRLREEDCGKEDIYEGEEYRELLGQGIDDKSFFVEHDKLQLRNLEAIWPIELRGKVIADVGCAAGSFLDHVAGLAKQIVAIEPCKIYHESLKGRGYKVFQYGRDALHTEKNTLDIVVSFSVIEHIENPRLFVEEIASLLKPGGIFIISTPNKDDILTQLEPVDYPSFFYRTVHRWYFNKNTLINFIERTGLKTLKVKHVHRFGISNAFTWLKERKPGGCMPITVIDSDLLDAVWKTYLEEKGFADYIFAVFQK